MARSRKRVKRKSNVRNCQYPQPEGATQKRNTNRNISEAEPTCIPHKRRRTTRYNLRQSNSVILVDETPCCQTPELQEKYTKLGLNSALFLKGSQRPKRKQSHISIITISSDDEETSVERTSEWVNSLCENYQFRVEPEQSSVVGIPEKNEQTFQPLCSSTPNTSQSTVQHQPDVWIKTEEFGTLTQSSTEASTGCRLDKVNEPQEPGNFSYEDQRSHTSPLNDPVGQEQTFQLVISIPDSLTDSQSVMKHQTDELNKAENSGYISPECLTGDRVETFNEAKETGYKSSYQGLGSSFNFPSGFNSTSTSLFFQTPINSGSSNLQNKKPLEEPPKVPNFYFGSSTETINANSTLVSPFASYFNGPMDLSTSSGFKFGSPTPDERQGETNQFNMPDANIMKNTNNQTDSNSLSSDDLDVLLERNSYSKSS